MVQKHQGIAERHHHARGILRSVFCTIYPSSLQDQVPNTHCNSWLSCWPSLLCSTTHYATGVSLTSQMNCLPSNPQFGGNPKRDSLHTPHIGTYTEPPISLHASLLNTMEQTEITGYLRKVCRMNNRNQNNKWVKFRESAVVVGVLQVGCLLVLQLCVVPNLY